VTHSDAIGSKVYSSARQRSKAGSCVGLKHVFFCAWSADLSRLGFPAAF